MPYIAPVGLDLHCYAVSALYRVLGAAGYNKQKGIIMKRIGISLIVLTYFLNNAFAMDVLERGKYSIPLTFSVPGSYLFGITPEESKTLEIPFFGKALFLYTRLDSDAYVVVYAVKNENQTIPMLSKEILRDPSIFISSANMGCLETVKRYTEESGASYEGGDCLMYTDHFGENGPHFKFLVTGYARTTQKMVKILSGRSFWVTNGYLFAAEYYDPSTYQVSVDGALAAKKESEKKLPIDFIYETISSVKPK